jgi:hypothetical protein
MARCCPEPCAVCYGWGSPLTCPSPAAMCAGRGVPHPTGWYYFKINMGQVMWWMKWMTVGGQGPEAVACCAACVLGRLLWPELMVSCCSRGVNRR